MKAAGPLNLPPVRDQGPVSVRRDLNNPAYEGYMRAASARDAGAQALARGLNAFAAGLEKMGEDRDKAKVLEAYNNYVTRSSETLYNAENGLMNAQGAGAEGLTKRVGEAHESLRSEVTMEMTPRQQRMFMESVAAYDRDAARSAMKYEGRAMAEYRKSEALKALDNMAAAWAAAPDDISMETQEDSVYSIVQAVYGDQGESANAGNISAVRSQLVARAALLLAERDPIRAESFIEEYGELMEPSARETVTQKVREAALAAHIQEDTPKLFEEYGLNALDGALQYIRDNYSGTEEEKRLSAARSYWNEVEQNLLKADAKAYDDIIGLMDNGGKQQDVLKAIKDFKWYKHQRERSITDLYKRHFGLPPYNKTGGGSGARKTNRDVWLRLLSLQYEGKLLDVAKDWYSFEQQFVDHLGDGHVQRYWNYYNDLRNGMSQEDLAIKMRFSAMFAKKLSDAKITDDDLTAQLIDRFNLEYNEMVRTAKGQPINREMVNELMKNILEEQPVGTTTKWGVFNRDVTKPRGSIPRDAVQGNDGRWYMDDGSGNYWPILYPGTNEYKAAEKAGTISNISGNGDWFISSSGSWDDDEDEDESGFLIPVESLE